MESDYSNRQGYYLAIFLMLLAFFTLLPSIANHTPPDVEVRINAHSTVRTFSYHGVTALDNCTAYFSTDIKFAETCRFREVPTQVALWLFLVVIIGFTTFLNRNKL